MRPDMLSYYVEGQPCLQHVAARVKVDFETKTLAVKETLFFSKSGDVYLDTRGLQDLRVCTEAGEVIAFTLGTEDKILGQCLSFKVPEDGKVVITFRTSPDASGLQWLTPEQTAGKRQPFVYSQGQLIHTRSFLVCQDTPLVRFTYEIVLVVPRNLRGLMAADAWRGREIAGEVAVERWAMTKRIPSYLVALAIGDLVCNKVTSRSFVWAERPLINRAKNNLAPIMNRAMREAEKLFCPYQWGRFDILVMPPSFPYGAMENPCLVFVNPTFLSGDIYTWATVCHELMHAWFGNLVTNATWSHWWLNEGHTTYAELRLIEACHGREAADMRRVVLLKELARDFAGQFRDRMHLTALVLPLDGTINPDELVSRVSYIKGALFIEVLERLVGRDRFDACLREYIGRFAFASITTNAFLDFMTEELPGVLELARHWHWTFGPGLPENAPQIQCAMVDGLERLAKAREIPESQTGAGWSAEAWVLYLGYLPTPLSAKILRILDERFHLLTHESAEVRVAFYLLCLESGDRRVLPAVKAFLAETGRGFFIVRLYEALAKREDTREEARGLYLRLRPSYHASARAIAEDALRRHGVEI